MQLLKSGITINAAGAAHKTRHVEEGRRQALKHFTSSGSPGVGDSTSLRGSGPDLHDITKTSMMIAPRSSTSQSCSPDIWRLRRSDKKPVGDNDRASAAADGPLWSLWDGCGQQQHSGGLRSRRVRPDVPPTFYCPVLVSGSLSLLFSSDGVVFFFFWSSASRFRDDLLLILVEFLLSSYHLQPVCPSSSDDHTNNRDVFKVPETSFLLRSDAALNLSESSWPRLHG